MCPVRAPSQIPSMVFSTNSSLTAMATHLFQKIDLFERATPHLDISALLPASQSIGHRNLENTAGVQSLLDGVQPIRLNIRNHQFHNKPPCFCWLAFCRFIQQKACQLFCTGNHTIKRCKIYAKCKNLQLSSPLPKLTGENNKIISQDKSAERGNAFGKCFDKKTRRISTVGKCFDKAASGNDAVGITRRLFGCFRIGNTKS